jgi:hypothetical protein
MKFLDPHPGSTEPGKERALPSQTSQRDLVLVSRQAQRQLDRLRLCSANLEGIQQVENFAPWAQGRRHAEFFGRSHIRRWRVSHPIHCTDVILLKSFDLVTKEWSNVLSKAYPLRVK